MPSFILNGAEAYSYNWHRVKTTPKDIVITKAIMTSFLAFLEAEISSALWAHVILTPDDNNITVFKRGKPHGFKTSIPSGGQTQPIAIEGARLQWKKAQKNAKKNIISDTINKIIPERNPSWTFSVWLPVIASKCISRNQEVMLITNKINENIRIKPSTVVLILLVKDMLCI